MKKIIVSLLLLFVLLPLGAAKLADYKALDKSKQSKIIFSQDFEAAKPPKEFKLPKGFEWKRGYGENGNGGLIFRRPKKIPQYRNIRIVMPQLKSGKRYRLEGMVSASGVNDRRGPYSRKCYFLGFDFVNPETEAYISSNYPALKLNDGELPWTKISCEFTVPEQRKAVFYLFLKKELTCREVRWDNIVISELGDEPPAVYPLSPLHLALQDGDTLVLRVENYIKNTGKLQLFAVLPDGRELDAEVKNGEAVLKVGKLAGKFGEIKFFVCDEKSKRVIGETVYPFTFNPPAPANFVKTDATGRVLVNGKPFFPIGMFMEKPEGPQEKFAHMRSMGVNTVLPYHNFELRLPEKRGKSALAKLRRSLDELDKNGLKLCFCLTELTGRLGKVTRFDGVKGRDDILKYLVNGLKDHPALLGWYVSDENPVSELGPIKDMRGIISRNDPFHPVLTLTDRKDNFIAFGTTGDIMMHDSYVVRDETTQDMLKIRDALAAERRDCRLGLWWVPQIFSWGVYPRSYTKPYQEMRWPSEEEMRSQSLLALNYRARGIIFYAYDSVGKHDNYVKGDAQKLWAIVERTVRLTAALEPWFMADAEPVELKVENFGKSEVEAKLHTANDGRKIIVIAAMGPGESNAVITLPEGNWSELKSRFGKTEMLKNGKYRFKGMNAASDILE